jgi:hypothetical protein
LSCVLRLFNIPTIVDQDLRPPSGNRSCGLVAQSRRPSSTFPSVWCPKQEYDESRSWYRSSWYVLQIPDIFCSLLIGLSSQQSASKAAKVERWNIVVGGVGYTCCECSFTNSVTSDALARLMIVMILDFCVRDNSIRSKRRRRYWLLNSGAG